MPEQVRKLRASFRAAGRGVGHALSHERNLRIHLCAAAYVVIFALLGDVDAWVWPTLFLCFGLMIGAELVNTAVERLCDKMHPGYDSAICIIKDLAAGAVLVCALCAAAAGLCIFLHPAVLSRIWEALREAAWRWVLLILSAPAALVFIFRRPREKLGKMPKGF